MQKQAITWIASLRAPDNTMLTKNFREQDHVAAYNQAKSWLRNEALIQAQNSKGYGAPLDEKTAHSFDQFLSENDGDIAVFFGDWDLSLESYTDAEIAELEAAK